MALKINPEEWKAKTMFVNRGTGALSGKTMELDPSTGPLPPSWEWKVVGASVVAQQNITNFIAKGYDPRSFDYSKRRNYASCAAHAFADGNRSRPGGYLLRIIEMDIEVTLPAFKRHLEQLKRKSNDRKTSRDTLRGDLKAIAIWIACVEYLDKLRGRDEVDVETLKRRVREPVRKIARELDLAETSDTLVLRYAQLVEDMAGWLDKRRKP